MRFCSGYLFGIIWKKPSGYGLFIQNLRGSRGNIRPYLVVPSHFSAGRRYYVFWYLFDDPLCVAWVFARIRGIYDPDYGFRADGAVYRYEPAPFDRALCSCLIFNGNGIL